MRKSRRLFVTVLVTVISLSSIWLAFSLTSEKSNYSAASSFNSVTHIHDVKAFGDRILMATHEGLFEYQSANSMKLLTGPVFDVMGLAVYGNTLFASGHPGPGTSFAEPIGFISSNDEGGNWEQISLAGVVDFHMLETGKYDFYGADSKTGQLMHSTDAGQTWKQLGINQFSDIAVLNEGSGQAYGLLEGSIVRTNDSFATVESVPSSLSWSSIEIVGSSIYGSSGESIYESRDGATSWQKIVSLDREISSISANEQLIVAVANGTVYVSRDSGKTFTS